MTGGVVTYGPTERFKNIASKSDTGAVKQRVYLGTAAEIVCIEQSFALINLGFASCFQSVAAAHERDMNEGHDFYLEKGSFVSMWKRLIKRLGFSMLEYL